MFFILDSPVSRAKAAEPLWPNTPQRPRGMPKEAEHDFLRSPHTPGPLFRTVSELFAIKVENNMLCFLFTSVFCTIFYKDDSPKPPTKHLFQSSAIGVRVILLSGLGLFKRISVRIQPRYPQVRGALRSGDIARRRGRSPVAILHCLLSIFAHVFTRIFLGLGLTLNADCAVLNYSRDLFLYYFR